MSPSPARTVIHCLHHDYIYYPQLWTYNGQQYEAGYYDENGNRYDTVAFTGENGDTTVELECEYCGTRAKYKWEEGSIPKCENCGAPMTVRDIQKDTVISGKSDFSEESSSGNIRRKKKSKLWPWILGLIILIMLVSEGGNRNRNNYSGGYGSGNGYGSAQQSAVNLIQQDSTVLYLKRTGNGIYEISDKSDYSKKLPWISDEDAYYDEATGAWLWYNDEVSPAVWQYWFEGLSSQYGDYGWMECEGRDWYIEVSNGNWKKYTGNTSNLWHIRNSFDD